MTTQITTLVEAEIHLFRSRAVVEHNGADMVEGKKLLELCGLSLNRVRASLQDQIRKHELVEDVDYSCTAMRTPSGQSSNVYHFTLNAANHILLAAMTQEGQTARQEAIDMRMSFNNIQQTNPTLWALMVHETQLAEQAKALEEQESRLSRVEHMYDSRGCDEGFMLRTDAYRQFGRGLSEETFKKMLQHYEVEQKTILVNTTYGTSATKQVHIESTEDAVAIFYTEIVPVSEQYFSHPAFENKRFKA